MFLCLTALLACQSTPEEIAPAPVSSFDLMQDRILTTQCAFAGCHASANDGLVLTKNLAYENLVNGTPQNANALKDGLKRVKPFDADKSLLYHKIHDNADGHHTSDYGKQMPLGGKPLKAGEIEFIRRWIAAGAPRTGDLVDQKLLD
jgi:hypothetical protein